MREITFSVCIPNFNYGGYIGETIESVLAQTYGTFEIVIVDNASTDSSWEVIQFYEQKDSRIRAYRNGFNVGFAPNLDKAGQKATNDFIIMLSSDDTMKPTALEEYRDILSQVEDPDKLLLCSATSIVDSFGKETGHFSKNSFHSIAPSGKYATRFNRAEVTDYDGLRLFGDLFPRFAVPGPFNSTCYSKKLYELVGGYASVNLIGPDGHFAYKCLLNGADVIFVDKPLFNYRVHNNQQLSTSSKNQNINVLIDRYIFSNYYSDALLAKAGLVRESFQKATLNTDCLNGALWKLQAGQWTYAFRHFCFGMAAYPRLAFRAPKTYVVFGLLVLGPLGILISKMYFRLAGKK